MAARRGIYRKYLALIISLVAGALVVSGAIGIYFSYLETRNSLIALAQEKAGAAASRIEQFVKEIEHQIGWTALQQIDDGANPLELRRFDYEKLLTQVHAITEATYIDPQGLEQVTVSRLKMNVLGAGTDLSQDPRFTVARSGGTYFGPVYFRKETEPYMAIALRAERAGRAARAGAGVTAVEVNLKFIWEVIQRIKIGKTGIAYVVNKDGNLVAHPDISLVLQKTDLSALPQVKAAVQARPAAPGEAPEEGQRLAEARDRSGRAVLTAFARIEPLDWYVFVEQATAEAYQPLYASLARSGALLFAGLLLSVLAGLVFARRMTDPIRALQDGAVAIGSGNLNQRIDVRTGDELQELAEHFNRMAAELKDSYAGLERKVEERTAELKETLEQQTATSEILRVISSSPTDVQPVFDAIVRNAVALCDGMYANVFRFDGERLHLGASNSAMPEFVELLRKRYPMRPDRSQLSGRVVLGASSVLVEDATSDPEYEREMAAKGGYRRILGVPMLREGRPLGAIVVAWAEAGPILRAQQELLQTFADQAAIAIENVRLFNETKESLEQQTATAEILRVIGGTMTETQPVFDAIVKNCHALFVGSRVALGLVRDGRIEVRASVGGPGIADAYDIPIDRESGLATCVMEARIVHLPDLAKGADEFPRLKQMGLAAGYGSGLFVPLMREGEPIGAISVLRPVAGGFKDKEIELLRTFADQAVIAIENVRLFNEIQDKSRQLEIANRHKSEFLANMSHELRTPLNAIIGFSEVLAERYFGELTEKQDEYVRDIHGSGKHLLTLINDILDLSKIEAGRMELDLSDFDLPAALQNALTLVKERAQRHGIALGLEVDASLGMLRADERKFKQIMINLLSNAVKFTAEGGRVSVAAKPNGSAVEVSIADTGVGIAAEDQHAVFEEFKQVGRDYTRKAEGTGLGLALTRRFVELHGGTISLQSVPGKGSTFTFTLPFRHGQ